MSSYGVIIGDNRGYMGVLNASLNILVFKYSYLVFYFVL